MNWARARGENSEGCGRGGVSRQVMRQEFGVSRSDCRQLCGWCIDDVRLRVAELSAAVGFQCWLS